MDTRNAGGRIEYQPKITIEAGGSVSKAVVA